MTAPERGEVWIVDLGIAAKIRPGLVLSIATQDEDWALATLVPHTTRPRGTRFEVAVKTRFLSKGVFNAQGLVTVPHAKLIRKIGSLSGTSLAAIEASVRLWLGL